jgi:hypothetical protein
VYSGNSVEDEKEKMTKVRRQGSEQLSARAGRGLSHVFEFPFRRFRLYTTVAIGRFKENQATCPVDSGVKGRGHGSSHTLGSKPTPSAALLFALLSRRLLSNGFFILCVWDYRRRVVVLGSTR